MEGRLNMKMLTDTYPEHKSATGETIKKLDVKATAAVDDLELR